MQYLKFIIFFVASFINSIDIFAENFDDDASEKNTMAIYLNTGLLTFDFNSLISDRNIFLKKLPFQAKITDDFPNNPYYQFEINIGITSTIVYGITYSHFSTGTRINYCDYSGEYNHDNIVSNEKFGIQIKSNQANSNSPFKLQFIVEIGRSITKIKMLETQRIFENTQTKSDELIFSQFYLDAGINLNYFYKGFIIFSGVGYSIEPEKVIPINYNGLKAHFGIGYILSF